MTDNENQGATVDRIIGRDTPTDGEREDEHQAQMIAFEGAKLDARNSMRHDPHVWHEALEDALDKVLPAVWHAAAGFRRSEVPSGSSELPFDLNEREGDSSQVEVPEPSAEARHDGVCDD